MTISREDEFMVFGRGYERRSTWLKVSLCLWSQSSYQRKLERFQRSATLLTAVRVNRRETTLRFSIIALQNPNTVRAIFQRMEHYRQLRAQMFAEFVRRPKLPHDIL